MREHKTEKCIAGFGARAVDVVTKGDRRSTEVTTSTAGILPITIINYLLPISNRNTSWEDD